MGHLLNELKVLDDQVLKIFEAEELDSEQLLLLIDKREQLLQEIINEYQSVPDFKSSAEWQEALKRTQSMVAIMQSSTNKVGEQLRKYRHGNKSVQRYQQFL